MKKKLRRKVSKILKIILIVLSLVLIFLSIYIRKSFGDLSFEQLLYSLTTSTGTSLSSVLEGFIFVGLFSLGGCLFIKGLSWIWKNIKYSVYFVVQVGKWKFRIMFFNVIKNFLFVCFVGFAIVFSGNYLGFFEYVELQLNSSTLFEDYYVDASEVEFKFPSKKKNLIYIVVESLEGTLMSIESGGAEEVSYIPNLEKMASDNISFSNSDKLGGLYIQSGNSWTAGALVSHTAGVPLKISINGNAYSSYGSFLPGVYSIGEVLDKNGYHNYFMLGSKAKFGGRKEYFEDHGNYEIMDYYWAIENGKISEDYYMWWGYEDVKLYEFAKQELLEISQNNEPFNFTMLTADTHFFDGYVGDNCPIVFEEQYANAFYCTDMMINDFINWIKEQDFYQDTVIIITGDHLTMQNNFFENITTYDRVVYNTFINTGISKVNSRNRKTSTMDLYPTTLAALGVEIPGNILGLGTNLFSNKKTLLEELGSVIFNEELEKRSNFYNNQLLKDTYYEMEKEKDGSES